MSPEAYNLDMDCTTTKVLWRRRRGLEYMYCHIIDLSFPHRYLTILFLSPLLSKRHNPPPSNAIVFGITEFCHHLDPTMRNLLLILRSIESHLPRFTRSSTSTTALPLIPTRPDAKGYTSLHPMEHLGRLYPHLGCVPVL